MTVCSIKGCAKVGSRRGFCGGHYWRWKQYGDPLAGKTSLGAPLRWLQTVALQASECECTLWPFGTYHDGYGQIRWNGRQERAHRVVCRLVHGDPPDESLDAAHNCGVRLCCNPHHVRWSTRKENIADMKVHGTVNRGARNGSVKLCEPDVIAIRAAAGIQEDIAGRFGVSRRLIGMIKRREVWGWL